MVDTPTRAAVRVGRAADPIQDAVEATADAMARPPVPPRVAPERDLTVKEWQADALADESSVIDALLGAEENKRELHAVFRVLRPAPTVDDPLARRCVLEFPIKPSDPKLLEALENECTTWERNQASGIRRVKDFDEPTFHRKVIAAHTIPTVKKAAGGVETIWQVYARSKGLFQPWEAVDRVLLHGEVRSCIRELEQLSGFNLMEIEQAAKN